MNPTFGLAAIDSETDSSSDEKIIIISISGYGCCLPGSGGDHGEEAAEAGLPGRGGGGGQGRDDGQEG